ncbi:hypothetical protein [Paenibacillus sp. USHLN196]|uniref:hypothetical protein n=1 Tax=Paenibacillus sp. USHLN196 TaxID=3081291 RepID=UPI003016346D
MLSDDGVCAPRLPDYDSRHIFTRLNHSRARSLCGVVAPRGLFPALLRKGLSRPSLRSGTAAHSSHRLGCV